MHERVGVTTSKQNLLSMSIANLTVQMRRSSATIICSLRERSEEEGGGRRGVRRGVRKRKEEGKREEEEKGEEEDGEGEEGGGWKGGGGLHVNIVDHT